MFNSSLKAQKKVSKNQESSGNKFKAFWAFGKISWLAFEVSEKFTQFPKNNKSFSDWNEFFLLNKIKCYF